MTEKNLVKTYAALRDKVRETLILGRQKIKIARVQTYWETGHYIHEHILGLKHHAAYGKQVIRRLARDLGVGDDLLYRCLRFAESFPISAARRKLSWAHYRTLAAIPDSRKRLTLLDRADQENWPSRIMERVVKNELAKTRSVRKSRIIDITPGPKHPPGVCSGVAKILKPRRGIVGTYRIRAAEEIRWPLEGALLFDHGFKAYRILSPREARGLGAGAIVEVIGGKLRKINRTEKDLFTYRAYPEKMIDADTFWVVLDTGLGGISRQKLRLRGIDAPEISTPEGKAAKKFVEELLNAAPSMIVCSSRNDKYDRYEADVFLPGQCLRDLPKGTGPVKGQCDAAKDGREVYLNSLLLETGHAVRMRGE